MATVIRGIAVEAPAARSQADRTAGLMEAGLKAMKCTLEAAVAPA